MDETNRYAPRASLRANLLSHRGRVLKSLAPRTKGILSALTSAMFLGMAPVFGKQAILFGLPWISVVALRTLLAAMLLLVVMLVFYRPFLYIYPAGLLGCLLAGWINGLGSLFYYSALSRIPAGVGQLLYSLYPLFLLLWLTLDNQPPSRLTLFRLVLALPAILLLTQAIGGSVDVLGMLMMLIAAALYALHLPFNQRVLYDMPAQTVTLYTLIAMSAMVVPVYLFSGTPVLPNSAQTWWPVVGLGVVTFSSRIMLFLGVKNLGGMQTAILGLSELLVTIVLAHFWLHETFSLLQWIGTGLLMMSVMLVGLDKTPPKRVSAGWLSWLTPPGPPEIKF